MYRLNTGYSSKQIFIKSDNSTITLDGVSNSIYFFKEHISVLNNVTILLSLVDAQIPISYYVVTSSNNLLDYTVNSINYQYNLEIGNPNISELITELNSNLTNLTATYNSKNNKITFSSSFSFSLNSASTCFKFIGFTANTTHNSIANSLTSDSVCNLSGTKSIYVMIPNLHNVNIDNRTGSSSSCLVKIPATTTSNGILKYTNKSQHKVMITDKTINYIQIILQDDDENIIDLNNQDYSMTFQVDFIYPDKFKPDIFPIKDDEE